MAQNQKQTPVRDVWIALIIIVFIWGGIAGWVLRTLVTQ